MIRGKDGPGDGEGQRSGMKGSCKFHGKITVGISIMRSCKSLLLCALLPVCACVCV